MTSEEVVTPRGPPRPFLLVFMPGVSYLESFLARNAESLDQDMQLVYHSVPVECLKDPGYRYNLMHKYRDAIHVLDSPETNKV